MDRHLRFPRVPLLHPLMKTPNNVISKMSTDSALTYKLVEALSQGEMTPELASMKSGPLCHNRWLTTGVAIMFLWISNHGFTGKLFDKLKDIVLFMVQVYLPMFFEIKVKHSIVEAPNHIIT